MPEQLEAVLAEFLAELDPPETQEQAEAMLARSQSLVALEEELAVDFARILARAIGSVRRYGIGPGLATFEAEQLLSRRQRWGGMADG